MRTTANQRISMLASVNAASLRKAFPQSETKVQNQIYRYLKIKRWNVGRINTTGRYDVQKERWFQNPRNLKGMPDLMAFKTIGKRKVVLAVEVKSAKGKMSLNQKLFQEWWHYPAGDRYYLLVRSIEDVEKCLEEVKSGKPLS